jgi:hypothetical protein
MSEHSRSLADRWAQRALTIGGFILGGLCGLVLAPKVQHQLSVFGVDPFSFRPAAVIIVCCAVAGAVFTRIHPGGASYKSRR